MFLVLSSYLEPNTLHEYFSKLHLLTTTIRRCDGRRSVSGSCPMYAASWLSMPCSHSKRSLLGAWPALVEEREGQGGQRSDCSAERGRQVHSAACQRLSTPLALPATPLPTQPTSSHCEHSKPRLIGNPGRWPAKPPHCDCHSPANSAGGNPAKRLSHSTHATRQLVATQPKACATVSTQLPKVWPSLEIAVVGQRRFLVVAAHRPHQRPALHKPAQHGQGVGALQGKGRGGGW